LSREELKNVLVKADAIQNTLEPIPTQNFEETLEWDVTKVKLKTILKEVFDLLRSLPLDTKEANNSEPSTSSIAYDNGKVEEEKIQFWRKYKNRYNYIEEIKPKLPPLSDNDPVEENLNDSDQNNINPTVENDLNVNTQNNVQNDLNVNTQNNVQNDLNVNTQNNVQNDLNGKRRYTINDIIQNKEVYELLKSRLKDSPYDDPFYKNNVVNSKLTITLQNGETFVRPVSHVAPLILLNKCDDLSAIPLQYQKKCVPIDLNV